MVNTHPTTCVLSRLSLPLQLASPRCQQQLQQGLGAADGFRRAPATCSLVCRLCQCNYTGIQSPYWSFLPNGFLQTHINSSWFSSLGAFISFCSCIRFAWIKTFQKSIWISPCLLIIHSLSPPYSWPFTWRVY